MAQTDREALVALYIATRGSAWNDSRHWNTDAALSEWYGVKVNSQGRVVELRLPSNNLQGVIPPELGNLAALKMLDLMQNELRGHIPPQLGNLSALKHLGLYSNKLEGPIPPELGNLAALKRLSLSGNQLSGVIPPELGNLAALKDLILNQNKLSGPIPPELGNLAALESLRLWGNQLSGPIPPELGRLSALQYLLLGSNKLTGGPNQNESVLAWRSRMQSKLMEQERAEQEREQHSQAEEHARLEPGGGANAPGGRISSPGGRDSQRLFREQVASFAELDELTRKNHQALQDVKHLLAKPATGSFPSATELTEADKLQELDRLLAMAKTLGDVASRYIEDEDMQRKERSLGPGSEAYYTVVRSGLCNAYLAASVVGSGLVSTSEVGVMGKAGQALELISGAVPLVGGLAGVAGAALKAGDSLIQTRRVVKIADFAADAVECSKLAKSLALRLTGGLPDGTIPVAQDGKEQHTRDAAGVGWGPGGVVAEGVNEEAVMEWFIEEVANCEPSNCGGTTPIREVQAGRRLGKRHLHKLLTAVGRGCLEGTKTPEEKANRLFSVVLPEADSRFAETPNVSEGVSVRPPVSTPSHGVVQQLAAMAARLEALKADMSSDKKTHRTEVEALQGKITTLEKRLPKSRGGWGGSVDAGGGFAFAQEQKNETQEEFNERMENSARAADPQTVTADELRIIQADIEELFKQFGYMQAQFAALEEARGKKKKKGFRSRWRGKR